MNLLRANSVTSFASESVSAPIQQTISNIVFIRLEIEEACAFSNKICLGNLSSCVKDSGNNFCNGVQAGVCILT